MIIALSRFRVRNGMEADVRRAFRERPGLVEEAPGFRGFEVYADAGDPAVFTLITRWVDEATFRAWHASAAHARSHEGIPRGLRLDPAFTEIRTLEPVATCADPDGEEAGREAAAILGLTMARSAAVCVVTLDALGTVRWCNRAFEEGLRASPAELIGSALFRWMTEPDGERIRRALGEPDARVQSLPLNFVAADQTAFTLTCHLSRRPAGLLLVGEPIVRDDRALRDHLLQLNNELASALRETERMRRELAAAKDELDRSYWHLRKIQEVLPICMECGKVKTAESRWEDLVTYVKNNSIFLSHGYCPRCAARLDLGEG